MSKLTLELDLKGGETAAQKVRDLTKEVATLKGTAKGIKFNDFSNASASFRAANPQLFQAIAAANVPPVIRPPRTSGGGTSGGGRGGGGGRASRLISFFGGDGDSSLSKVFAGLGAFRIALWELQPIIKVVEFAMRELATAIHEGSKLFTDAAKLGQSAFKTAQLDFAAKGLNISQEQAQGMALAAEFSNRVKGGGLHQGRSGIQGGIGVFGGQALGTSKGINSIGQFQELSNLQTQFNGLQRKGLLDSILQGQNAETFFKTQAQLNALMNDFKTTVGELAIVFIPAINEGLLKFRTFFLLLNLGIEQSISKTLERFHLISKREDPNFQQAVVGRNSLNPNQFQKLGFNLAGGFPGSDVLKSSATKTAQNTSQAVTLLQQIAHAVGASGSVLGEGAGLFTNSP